MVKMTGRVARIFFILVLCIACDTDTNSGLAEFDSTETSAVITKEVAQTDEVSAVTVEPSIGDARKDPTNTIIPLEHATSTVTATNTVTTVPVAVETTIVPLPTSTLDVVAITSQDADQVEPEDAGEIELGIGGLSLDLEFLAAQEIAQFYSVSHIDISTLQFVSKFRSRAGHDYSDSFEKCTSLKHYFHPLNFYEVALTTPIYAPSDGAVVWVQKLTGAFADEWKTSYVETTGEAWPEGLADYQIFLRPDAAPNVWIRYHHVMPIDLVMEEIAVVETRAMMMDLARPKLPGYRVKAGDLIAHGLGEISIEQHLNGTGIPSPCVSADTRSKRGDLPGCKKTMKFLSMFDYMTDEVFDEYRKLADVERSDFKVSKEELAMNPYICTGEKFDNKGDTPDADTYVLLQGTRGESESNVIQDYSESAKDLRDTITSFEGNGDGKHGPFDGSNGDIIRLTSDGGPLSLTFSKEGDSRIIYTRPEGSANIVYEVVAPFGGQVSVGVTTSLNVSWEVVVFRAD